MSRSSFKTILSLCVILQIGITGSLVQAAEIKMPRAPCDPALTANYQTLNMGLPNGDTIELFRTRNVFGASGSSSAAKYGTVLLSAAFKSINTKTKRILVIGSGTGYEAIALARYAPQVTIDAIDILEEAVHVGKLNAKAYGLEDRIHFIQSDLFQELGESKYDLILFSAPRPVSEKYIRKARKGCSEEDTQKRLRNLDRSRFDLDGILLKRLFAELSFHLSNKRARLLLMSEAELLMSETRFDDFIPSHYSHRPASKEFFWSDSFPESGKFVIHDIRVR